MKLPFKPYLAYRNPNIPQKRESGTGIDKGQSKTWYLKSLDGLDHRE